MVRATKRRWRIFFILVGVPLSVSGCGTNSVFDYSVPTATNDNRITFSAINSTADSFSQQYTNRASSIASSSQAFDLLTMAGVAGTVFAIIFRGSVREVEALSAGTATSYGLSSYYATRARANDYFNGAVAMQCVSSLSNQANILFTGQNLINVTTVYDNTQAASQPTLQPLMDFPSNGPMLLSSAIDSINGKVLSNSIAASPSPDISTLQTTMLSQVQDSVTKQQAFVTAASNQVPHPGPLFAGATPVTINDIKPQIDFVSNFSPSLTACIAKAG